MIQRTTFTCLFALILQGTVLAQHTVPDAKIEKAAKATDATDSADELSIQSGLDFELDIPAPGKVFDFDAMPEDVSSLDLEGREPAARNSPVIDGPDSSGYPQPTSALRNRLHDVLKGKLPEDWPTEPMMLNVRYPSAGGGPSVRQARIDPRSKNLSMEQRRDVYLAMNLAEIRDDKQRLLKTENATERERILASLKSEYTARYEIDTLYQELKVQEIEERAAKLRAEVDKRAAYQDEWITTMVTLDKMRANGIDTMETVTASNQGYSDRGVSNNVDLGFPVDLSNERGTSTRIRDRRLPSSGSIQELTDPRRATPYIQPAGAPELP